MAAAAAAVLATVFTMPASAQLNRVTVQLSDGTLEALTIDLPPGTTLDQLRSGQVALAEPLPGTPVSLEPITEDAPPPPETTPPSDPPSSDPPSDPPSSDPPSSGPPSDPPSADPPASDQPSPPATAPPSDVPPRGDLPSGPRRETTPQHPAAADGQPSPSPRASLGRPQRRTGVDRARPRSDVHARTPSLNDRPPLRRPDGTPTPQNPGFVDALPGPSTVTGVPNFIIRKFAVPIFLLPIYQAAGIEYGVRWEVLAAINEIETDYGRNLKVSTAGAVGWMQFLPSSWRLYGVDGNNDGRRDPYNPVDAIFSAARYLKAAGYEKHPSTAIFAYNHADWYVDSVLLRARLIAGFPAELVGSLTGLTEGRFPVYAHARYADDSAEREDARRGIDIFARRGALVVAANDAMVKKVGHSASLGCYLVLQDAYGNRYTYAQLGQLARYYPVPKQDVLARRGSAEERRTADTSGPPPAQPASAGRQVAGAHRQMVSPRARDHGGFETYSGNASRPFGLDSRDAQLRQLKRGEHVVAGTILGRIGPSVPGKASHLHFEIRPAGRGAPLIDPKPILDGWKLLEATAIYRANGRNALRPGSPSLGQILLMPKPLLERRVLADPRLGIYPGGRQDIRSGQIDRRVLATLEYLAERGLRPTVTSLKSGHSFYTASGNISEHSSGNAVDIANVNGIPIAGHQEPGGIADLTVRTLMGLQGALQPHQIISLFDLGGPTLAMRDHADHIHVGFRPLFGDNRLLGEQAAAVLQRGQWGDLMWHLRGLDNPAVPTQAP